MDESAETQDQQVATQFGRWADVDEWFKEACRIKEKTRPSKEVKTIPVPGEWYLGIYIPMRAEGGYASAMETGMNLLAAMGTRPEFAYTEDGYFFIWLKRAEFYEAKALAVRVRRWLIRRAFKTTVGGCLDDWRAGVPAHLSFRQDNRNYAERIKELSMVNRLHAKLTGSTVKALIDLIGQYETARFGISEPQEETSQILQPLAKLLGIVLRRGTVYQLHFNSTG